MWTTERKQVTQELGEQSDDETFEAVYEELPCHWKYIELICKEYLGNKTLDLMYAYDDPKDRSRGRLFLGQWNNGYVER